MDNESRFEVLTGKSCSPPPRPPWRTAATSAATAAGWRSLSAWTWWRTGPTRWNPGTPGGGTREDRGRFQNHRWLNERCNLMREVFFLSFFFSSLEWIIKWLVCKFWDGGVLIKDLIGSLSLQTLVWLCTLTGMCKIKWPEASCDKHRC